MAVPHQLEDAPVPRIDRAFVWGPRQEFAGQLRVEDLIPITSGLEFGFGRRRWEFADFDLVVLNAVALEPEAKGNVPARFSSVIARLGEHTFSPSRSPPSTRRFVSGEVYGSVNVALPTKIRVEGASAEIGR